jgi:6-phosphogluconate dehydrogenase
MQVGMIGCGRMGANLVRRLMADGHKCVVFDLAHDAVDELVGEGATGSRDVEELVGLLETPRVIWIMVPAGKVQGTVDQLEGLLDDGDTVIDGGNSYYRDDIHRAVQLSASGVHYIDCGTSGGVWGLERGYSLMIGGEPDAVARLDPIWSTIAPGESAATATPGRATGGSAQEGYLHCGPSGSGHFVKMVHNGIEYGMMAAIAEGLSIIKHANVGLHQAEVDAETAPMRNPEYYSYEIDVAEVAEVWRRGSVIQSWLVDLTAAALADDPHLDSFAGRVSDSGEGRWTVMAAIEEGVPASVIAAALNERFESRDLGEFTGRVLSAMRGQFGGHVERGS